MSSEGQQHSTLADAAADVAAAVGPAHGTLHRLRAVFAAPTFIMRWRQRQRHRPADDALSGAPDSTLTFFSLDEDEPRGEVTLYPMDIDSEAPIENSTPEIPDSTEDPSLLENPLDKVKTLAEVEIDASALSLKPDCDDVDAPKAKLVHPQHKRMLVPAAPVAAVVVRCVCWMLAQRLVRQFLEKTVGATQRWLFANVCSRRTRLAVIGVASILWGMLVGAVSVCAIFVIIAGDLESVIEEAAQLGEWCDAIATTTAATFLAIHLAQVLFGALLIAASKVTGYRALEGNVKLMEKILLVLFEFMKVDITAPPPAPCNHEPPSPSSSSSSSRRGSICSQDEIRTGDRDRSPQPCGSKQEQCRPSHSETPPPLPSHSSHSHIGWVRPEERDTGNDDQKWPELPGNWRAPDFSQTISNPSNSVSEPSNILPYPVPCNTNAYWTTGSNISETAPGNTPYPIPNHSPYQGSNFFPNPVARDFPYPGPSLVPYIGPSTSREGGHSIGFQTPPGVFIQKSTVEVKNYSVKVRILKRQTSPGQESPLAEDEPEQRWGPSPVPHLLMPWLYTAWVTLGAYALLSTGLATVGRGAVAAAVGALELPAVACVVDVFAELRGVPESCSCKEVRSIGKGKKNKNEENVNSRSMASPPPRKTRSVYDETSPLLH